MENSKQNNCGGLLQNVCLQGAEIAKLEILREQGRTAFAEIGLPSPKTEAWKYTRVREVAGADFVIEPTDDEHCACGEHNCGCGHEHHHCSCGDNVLPFDAYEIHFCNGKLKEYSFHLPDGVEVMSLLDAATDGELFAHLNKSFEMQNFPFATLNTAYLEQGILLRVARDFCPDKPIALVNHTHAENKIFANMRNVIVLESGAKATVVEYYHYSGAEKSEYFNNIVNEFFIGRNALLNHYKVQAEAFKAVHITLNAVAVKAGGKYESFCLQTGANLARQETHVVLKEEQAEAEVDAVYKMNGWAMLDTTTDIEHLASYTRSNQLVKGIVGGQAKGVFQGKIHIAPMAEKTEGYQLHRALLLSDTAEVDVKPELEIFADDIKCSHGAACGELDKEQMFYLQSRGISEDDARAILIQAFADEGINKIKDEKIREWVRSLI